MARDRNGPRLAGQVLMCPMLDDRNQTASSVQFDGGILIRLSNVTGWTVPLGDRRGTDDVSIHAAPAPARPERQAVRGHADPMGQSGSTDLACGVDEDLGVFFGLAEGGESGLHTRESNGSGDQGCRVDRSVGEHV